MHYGSPKAGLALLRGQPLLIEPTVLRLERIQVREERTFKVRASNLTGRSIPIMDGADHADETDAWHSKAPIRWSWGLGAVRT